MASCPHCFSTGALEYVDARGESICTECGLVVEEGAMVESLQFAESSSGAIHTVGQFVPAFGAGRHSNPFTHTARENKEQLLARGYANIQKIADSLRLSAAHVDAAQRIYNLAVQRSFTVGRNNFYVGFACLYAICRREKTPHMLIDFSDVLQTCVRSLGQIFMKLVRLLHIQVPCVDPSLFMERYAGQMQLGEETVLVAATGVRLIQAMTRDWISTGRRPTGLCGAALLIAARYHGLKIASDTISKIVRISSPTINKRLYEFRRTCVAQLTCDEFETCDTSSLPILRGPPCVGNRQEKHLPLPDLPLPATDNESTSSPEREHVSVCHPESTVTGSIVLNAEQSIICSEDPTAHEISSLAKRVLVAIQQTDPADTQADNSSDPLAHLITDIHNKAHSILHEMENEAPVETLSDISDSEIQQYMLTETQKQTKAILWDELTKDIMPDVVRRWDAKGKNYSHDSKRPQKKSKIHGASTSETESVKMALGASNKERLASRLNEDVLDKLFDI